MAPRPRSPGFVFGGVALVLLILLAAFAFTQRQPPPPTIAEFAPQAVENIVDAPTDQSSSRGGRAGPGGEAETPPPPPDLARPVIDVPRVRKCVGDPPRQVEDPQSPPCVPYWTGDNGGETSKGVGRDEIRIGVPYVSGGAGANADGLSGTLIDLQAFFNRRFEFYGRQLRLIKYPGTAAANRTQEAYQADAVGVDEQIKAFASLPPTEWGGAEFTYYDELARRGTLSMHHARSPLNADDDYLAERSPFVWSVLPTLGATQRGISEWICRQLAAQPAAFAGPEFAGRPRKFGVVLGSNENSISIPIGPLKTGMAACNAEPVVVADVRAVDQPAAQNAMLQLRQAGVTSVIGFAAELAYSLVIFPAATNQGYQPEWLVNNFGVVMQDNGGQLQPRDQMIHAFGIDYLNKKSTAADQPTQWAISESNPGGEMDLLDPHEVYWPMLMLASGIQMAGPKLTPQTFKSALARTTFPNPGHGAAPFYQAHVGFGPSDFQFFNDATIEWWNPGQRSAQNDQPGAFCYLDHGLRYGRAAWRTGQPALFDPSSPCG